MQRLVLYTLAIFLFVSSFWLSVWPFAVIAVLLLAAYGYGYSAALLAFVVDALWGYPAGFLHYLGICLMLVIGITVLRAVLMPHLRSRVPSII
ncbi:MAG: hypothetical protein QG621_715 [Patescibacteria group bacterium]|nr:hypothetical protein [Patescibacteria group bacterium]